MDWCGGLASPSRYPPQAEWFDSDSLRFAVRARAPEALSLSSMRITTSSLLLAVALAPTALGEDKAQLRAPLKDTEPKGDWIYDLGLGFLDAKKSGRPLMVVFRCVP